jgi:predicted Zn-ribbon and HTH transcriptional regulator
MTKIFWQFVIWRLRVNFGKPCKTWDYDDFPEFEKDINAPYRCPACCANQIIRWIERVCLDK